MTRLLQIGGAAIVLAGLLYNNVNSFNPHPVRWSLFFLVVFVGGLVAAWKRVEFDTLDWVCLGFVGYAILSLSWSLDWREGIMSLNALVILMGLFILLRHVEFQHLVPWCAAICILFSAVQPRETFGGMRNENFQAEFLCLLIPLCFVGRRIIPALVSLVAVVVLIFFNPSDAKWMGLAGAVGLFCLYLLRREHYMAVAGFIVVGFFGVVLGWTSYMHLAVMRRLELGYDTLLMWLDHPLFGVGIGGFNFAYPLYQERHPALIEGHAITELSVYAGAAHNEYLQALAVFGLVGVSILCIILFMILRQPNNGLVALSVLGGLALVNFPMQNPSTAVLGVVALALVCPVSRKSRLAEHTVDHSRASFHPG